MAGNPRYEYFEYTQRNTSIVTVGDFINGEGSIAFGMAVGDFLNYADENEITNAEKIFAQYTTVKQTEIDARLSFIKTLKKLPTDVQNTSGAAAMDYELPIGTTVCLPFAEIDSQITGLQGNQVVKYQSSNAFIAAALNNLFRDKNYVKRNELTSKSLGVVKDIVPDVTIWLWSRVLSAKTSDEKISYDDTIVNITPYVSNVSTNASKEGGSFSFSLAPIVGELENGRWTIKPDSVKGSNLSFVSDSNLHQIEQGELKRNNFYFNRIIQENDVVFIRFETLEGDQAKKQKNIEETTIDVKELQFGIYDMIGLVDSNTISTSPSSNEVSIDISGRDLMKLFIEDGVYFYAFDYIPGGMFANEKTDQRLQRYDGKLLSRFQQSFKTIDNIMKFVINALGNIEICSDSLFKSYGDRRSSRYDLVQEDKVIKAQREDSIDSKTLQATQAITDQRRIDKLLKGAEKPTIQQQIYDEIKNFLEQNKDKVIEVANELTGWQTLSYKGGVVKQNYIPPSLNDASSTPFYARTVKKLPNNSGVTKAEYEQAKADKEVFEGQKNGTIKRKEILLEEIRKNLIVLTNKNIPPQQPTESNGSYHMRLREEFRIFKVNRSEIDEPAPLTAAQGEASEKITVYNDELYAGTISYIEEKDTSPNQSNLDLALSRINRYEAGERRFEKSPRQLSQLSPSGQLAFKLIWQIIKLEKTRPNPRNLALQPLKGIWSIIHLVIDQSIHNRRVVSSDIGNEHGSLITAIKKICQEPFTEFYGDTYGDMYYLTVRKPPYDKQGYISLLNGRVDVEPLQRALGDTPLSKDEFLVINIREEDILSEDLVYGGQAYSWYKLIPQSTIAGTASTMSLAYLKAIYFKEYADIWGSKPLDLVTNYVPYYPVKSKDDQRSTAFFIEQGMRDLKFMIDCNAYLPFVRRGTVTINLDRRIKKGMMIRLVNSSEVFYVTSVAHNWNINNRIDNTTTLTLERGMVERFITHEKFNYFNIIDTSLDEALFKNNKLGYEQFEAATIGKWKVNVDVFNFFLTQQQFAQSEQEKLNSLKGLGDFYKNSTSV